MNNISPGLAESLFRNNRESDVKINTEEMLKKGSFDDHDQKQSVVAVHGKLSHKFVGFLNPGEKKRV